MTDSLEHMTTAYRAVAQSICNALTHEHPDAWGALPAILRARLSERERGMLAYFAMYAMDVENVAKVIDSFTSGAGMPGAPFFNHMDEAAFWADMADPGELEAYALACFNRMELPRQKAFLSFIRGRAAA